MVGGGAAVGRAYKGGPSVMREIIYGMTLGLMAGGLWKIHHWNNQRRTREFYDLLDRGEITVVVPAVDDDARILPFLNAALEQLPRSDCKR